MSQKTQYGSMMHLNGNILCAVDCETTGFIPGHHDIASICIMPLNEQIQPHPDILPFALTLVPKRKENADPVALRKNGMKLSDLILNGIDPWRAVDLFEEWFENLKLPIGKKIAPLAHNWPFDREWIIDWMGRLSFENYFHHRYRDPLAVGSFENDRADFHNEPYPYAKLELRYLATALKVDVPGRLHEAMMDCLAAAEVYRKMIFRTTGVAVNDPPA